MKALIASAAVSAGLAALLAWQAQGWRWAEKLARVEQSHAQAVAQAQQQAREKEQSMQKEVERIADESSQRESRLAFRAAAAERIAGGLRDEIARLNTRPAPTDPGAAAFDHEARVARELLGACAAEYRTVAREADVLRDQVIGLQDYVGAVLKFP